MEKLDFDTKKVVKICRKNDASMIGVFGSMAKGEATSESDVDLLLKFSTRKSLLSLVKLERELSSSLGRKVELLTEASISPYLRDRINRELRIIYEA